MALHIFILVEQREAQIWGPAICPLLHMMISRHQLPKSRRHIPWAHGAHGPHGICFFYFGNWWRSSGTMMMAQKWWKKILENDQKIIEMEVLLYEARSFMLDCLDFDVETCVRWSKYTENDENHDICLFTFSYFKWPGAICLFVCMLIFMFVCVHACMPMMLSVHMLVWMCICLHTIYYKMSDVSKSGPPHPLGPGPRVYPGPNFL